MKGKTVLILSVVLLTGIALAAIGTRYASQNYEFRGSSFEPFPDAYQYELTDYNGEQFRLKDQRGKVVLMFFGYTNCPDVCPTTLSHFKRIYAALGEQAKQVAFVFVSVDPARDTREKVGEYVSAFNSAFIGLSGTEEELRPVWDGYFIFQEPEQIEEHDDEEDHGYLVAHTSRIYVIDPAGKLRLTFPYGMSAEDMTTDVAHLLTE